MSSLVSNISCFMNKFGCQRRSDRNLIWWLIVNEQKYSRFSLYWPHCHQQTYTSFYALRNPHCFCWLLPLERQSHIIPMQRAIANPKLRLTPTSSIDCMFLPKTRFVSRKENADTCVEHLSVDQWRIRGSDWDNFCHIIETEARMPHEIRAC